MEEDIYSLLIGQKKENSHGELIVVLFELCDLTCQVCYQDHDSWYGTDNIVEKYEIIIHAINVLKGRGKKSISINLMGGELFSDKLPDKIFDDYLFLLKKLKNYGKEIEIPLNFSIPSNMIWHKKDRIRKFLDESKISLNASYDPAGRFNPKTLSIFIENVKEFSNYIKQIGVVMTKPNMKKIINDQSPHFDFLYKNFEINFDHYTHSQRSKVSPEILMPKDVDLRDFYKFMIEKYPKCYPFLDALDKNKQPMSCMRTMYVFPDSSFGSCGSVEKLITPLSKTENKKIIRIIKDTTSPLEKKIEMKWYKEYDCLSCKHLQRCSMGCFLNNHFYSTRTQEECWLKEVYDSLEK